MTSKIVIPFTQSLKNNPSLNPYCVLDAENTKMSKRIILETLFWAVKRLDICPVFNGDLK